MSLSLSCELLQTLLFRKTTNKKFTLLFSNDIAIKALNNNFSFLCCMNYTILTIKEMDISSYNSITIDIMLCLCK